ncbi:hypothetical protein NQD34_001166 [Periophthalmus magnuspinnatus]|nr:hypothetical protein NQD34_001166 [Periophthalmus magnuspinnatus]
MERGVHRLRGRANFASTNSNESKDLVLDFKRNKKRDKRPVSLPDWESAMSHTSEDSREDVQTDPPSHQNRRGGYGFRPRSESSQDSRDLWVDSTPEDSRSGPNYQSLRSVDSREQWVEFKNATREDSRSGPNYQSLRSVDSREQWVEFKDATPEDSRSGPNYQSLRSVDSREQWVEFKEPSSEESKPGLRHFPEPQFPRNNKNNIRNSNQNPQSPKNVKGHGGLQHNSGLDHIFQILEKKISAFMRNELKMFFDVLSMESEYSMHMMEGDEEKQRSSEAFLKITRFFLLEMGHEELVHRLQNQIHYPEICQRKLKSNLERRYRCVYEGVAKAGTPTLLKNIYTELHVTEGGAIGGEANKDLSPHTSPTLHNIFRGPAHQHEPIRTVVTKGVAGVGKTLLTQKFCLDWAEGKAHQDFQLLLPFTFRELNVFRDAQISLVGLVHHFFSETKKTRLYSFKNLKVLFILDGLDESQISLDFRKTKAVSDIAERVSMDVLLVNLLRGNLLPSAQIWITTRPAAANKIPAECISMVTEVTGFTNSKKDKYFSLKFKDQTQASAIISHIKGTRSLYIMCHLPIFCWILFTVLLHVLKTGTIEQLPQTLTEMYIHFLVVQTKLRSLKYDGRSQTDTAWRPETRKMVRSLGKLAFEQLQKRNLIFYECDLSECGLDAEAASLYSGLFTQVYMEESGLYQDKVYCFIHESVQEFLAALHVHQTFINTGINLLSEEKTMSIRSMFFGSSTEKVYQTAVDQMLQSPNGHLDLFTRFLLGLSLPSNQERLKGLVKHSGPSIRSPQKTAQYITERLEESLDSEKIVSLFYCLNELKERGLVEQIQERLSSGRPIRERLSQAQWSALVFILLSSDHLEVFDLKKYCASEEALLNLLPVVKASSTALLNSCDLTEKSCEVLCMMVSAKDCALTELDLSYNQIQDSGLKYLALALRSPHCRLQRLRLAGCQVTGDGCVSLASVLRSHQTHLTLLDLSKNHPGPTAVKQLSALQGAPHSRLETLILRPSGPQWLRPLIKYFTRLTLDPTTAYPYLKLSQNSTKASHVEQDQAYPDHTSRFDKCPQLLCSEGLSGRTYWEVEWSGSVLIAVSYRSFARKGNIATCGFGLGPDSWCLSCSKGTYTVTHKGKRLDLPYSSSSRGRAAVYVDFLAGAVSFYAVSLEELVHLHTFKGTFNEPLVPGFRLLFGSTVKLCDLLEEKPSYV